MEGLIPFEVPAWSDRRQFSGGITVIPDGAPVGEVIKEVHGGPTILLSSPDDLDLLRAMSRGQPDRLLKLALTGGLDRPRWVVWTQLNELLGTESTSRTPDRSDRCGFVGDSDFAAALDLTQDVWRSHHPEEHGISAALSLLHVKPNSDGKLLLSSEEPVMFLSAGSVATTVAKVLWKPVTWVFSVSRSRVGASVIARDLKVKLRERAFASSQLFPPLPDIAALRPEDVHGAVGLVVYVHGLASTDVKTFDRMVDTIRRVRPGALCVGFAHNSLTSIDVNAQELSAAVTRLAIGKTAGTADIPVVFVGHSRGGLVARCTVAQLLRSAHQNRWRANLKGIVTFGTPHLGATLAEAPMTMIGVLAVLAAARQDSSLVLVRDVLDYLAQDGQLQGVEDLRPADGSGKAVDKFLRGLVEAENVVGGVPMVIVGGASHARGRVGKIVKFLLGDEPNDFVVHQRSSVHWKNPNISNAISTRSNHFGYFDDVAESKEGLAGAVSAIEAWLP